MLTTEAFVETVLDRLAESYAGLLGFGGELLSKQRLERLAGADAELEHYFEQVPVSDQRSVSLNQALDLLGNWVLLGDHHFSPALIRERLSQTVRDHLRQAHVEQEQHQAAVERQQFVPDLTFILSTANSRVLSAVWVDSDSRLLTSDDDGKILLWDLRTRMPQVLINDGSGRSHLKKVQGSDRFLIYPSGINSALHPRFEVRSWSGQTKAQNLAALIPSDLYIISVLPAPSGQRMLVHSMRREGKDVRHFVHEIEVDSTGPAVLLTMSVAHGLDLNWSEDESRVAAVWQLDEHGRKLEVFERGPEGVQPILDMPILSSPGAAYFDRSDNSRVVMVGERSGDGAVSVYDLETRSRVPSSSVAESVYLLPSTDTLWSQRSQSLVLVSMLSAGEVLIWNAETQRVTLRVPAKQPSAGVKSMVLSPSERFLAIAYEDESVDVWEIASGRIRYTIPRSKGYFLTGFSDDERFLAVKEFSRGLRVWNLEELVSQ